MCSTAAATTTIAVYIQYFIHAKHNLSERDPLQTDLEFHSFRMFRSVGRYLDFIQCCVSFFLCNFLMFKSTFELYTRRSGNERYNGINCFIFFCFVKSGSILICISNYLYPCRYLSIHVYKTLGYCLIRSRNVCGMFTSLMDIYI